MSEQQNEDQRPDEGEDIPAGEDADFDPKQGEDDGNDDEGGEPA